VARVDIAVPGIPQPLASYTPATRAGDLVFAAGHLASDFKHGVAPEARLDPAFPFYGSSIKKQTRYVLENLARTFEAAGTSLNSSQRRRRGRRSAPAACWFPAAWSRST
jgi:enamine deaminase RidA (YjgF/YER057c/UK114 family)